MKTRICSLLLFCLAASPRSFSQSPVSPEFAQRLQDKIDSCVTHYDLPGISVSLILPGNQYWNGASGFSDIYSMTSMDTALLFQQASVTKMFVSTTVLQLAEQGLLSIEDSIGTYLPAITNIPGSIKIKYLLNHRSGLYEFLSHPAASSTWFTAPDSIWNHQLCLETYNGVPMFAPNSSFYYCNTNYVLLGMIIEQVTGNTFAQEVNSRFLSPLGLTQTFMVPDDSVAGNITPGWTSFTTAGVYDTDASVILNDCYASMVFTAGGLVSRPVDVAHFTRLLHSGQLLDDTTLAQMKTFTSVAMGGNCNGYGLGCMRYIFSGPKTFYGHSGDISGFTQFSAHNPTDSITLTISINRNNAPRGPIAQAILNIVYDELAVAGVNENEMGLGLQVYPNPAEDFVSVAADGAVPVGTQIVVYNTVGKLVLHQALNNTPVQVDMSELPAGIYFLKMVTGTEVMAVRKIVKAK